MIARQAYGRQVTNVCLNDAKTNDSKLFFGFDASLEENQTCPYTIITSSSELTVVYKVIPEQLKELLRHEKKCIHQMKRRFKTFYQAIEGMRKSSLQGQLQKDQLLDSNQVEKTDYSNIDKDLQYGS